MKNLSLKSCILTVILCTGFLKSYSQTFSANTVSQLNNHLDDIEFKVLLATDVQKVEAMNLTDYKYFIPLINYIDLNVIGKGKTVTINTDMLVDFIKEQI